MICSKFCSLELLENSSDRDYLLLSTSVTKTMYGYSHTLTGCITLVRYTNELIADIEWYWLRPDPVSPSEYIALDLLDEDNIHVYTIEKSIDTGELLGMIQFLCSKAQLDLIPTI